MKSTNNIIIVFALAVSIVLFQNCSQSMTFKSNGEPDTQLSSLSDNGDQPGLSFGGDGSGDPSMKVSLSTNQAAQTDCSLDAASLSLEVLEAAKDIRVCLQYEIDQPVGSPRHNDKYFCDRDSKFEAPPSNWTYDAVNRRWSTAAAKLKNNAQFIPGAYALFVKDSKGRVVNSASAVIKKTGAVNCEVAGSNPNKCAWSGAVFGPSLPSEPTTACTVSNVNTTAKDGSGNVKTCRCDNIPVPEYTIQYGTLGAPVYGTINIGGIQAMTGSSSPPLPVGSQCFIGGRWHGYYNCGPWQGTGQDAYTTCTSWEMPCNP